MNRQQGLTLIELVLAMSLSIVILVILFAGLRLGYKAQERGTAKAEETQKLRIINDRISWLLRGVYPYLVNRPDMRRLAFEGTSGRVGFVTTSIDTYGTGPEDRAGLKWVTLEAGSKGLMVQEKVFFLTDIVEEGSGREYILDPDVKKIEFSYYDVPPDMPGKEKEGEWVAEWNTEERQYLPSAVKVQITLKRGDRSETMPDMVVRLNVLTTM